MCGLPGITWLIYSPEWPTVDADATAVGGLFETPCVSHLTAMQILF